MEKIRQRLRGLINDLKWKPQNPAYVITKDDIIDALTEAINYVDEVSEEGLYDLTDLQNVIEEASSEVYDASDDANTIENKLNTIITKMKKCGMEAYVDEIEEIKEEINELGDRLHNISYNLTYSV